MRSRRMRIHLRLPLTSVFVPYLQTSRNIIIVLRNKHMRPLNIHPSISILLNMQLMLFRIIPKQILNLLHINLNEATPNEILSLLTVRIDNLENMLKRSWHDTSLLVRVRVPNHRVGLATPCLAVCEYCCFKLSLTYHCSPL